MAYIVVIALILAKANGLVVPDICVVIAVFMLGMKLISAIAEWPSQKKE